MKKLKPDIKKNLKEFYESHGHYGEVTSMLFDQYGTDGHDVKDPTRFMVMYEGQLKEIMMMIPPGQDILDVGTGEGLLAGLLLKDAKTLTALDISMKRIKRCCELYRNGYFIIGDAEELPFRGDRFDYVVGSELIEHLIEPERFLMSSHYVLRDGGTLIISTPSALFYEDNLSQIFKDHHLHTFSPRRLKRLLKKTGFKSVGIRGIGFKLRVRIPKILAVLPRIFYVIITRRRPKRGFIAPVSVEWNLATSRFLNKLYIKNEAIHRKIFRLLNFIGKKFPSLASQVIIRVEK